MHCRGNNNAFDEGQGNHLGPIQVENWDKKYYSRVSLCFINFKASICSAMAFPPLKNFDHVIVSVSIGFPSNSKWDIHFIAQLMTILLGIEVTILGGIGMVFVIIWEIFFEGILNQVVLLLLVNFMCQLSGQTSLISMVFCSLCCCHSSQKSLFCLHQQNKSSKSNIKFRQDSNHSKRVPEATKVLIK